MKFYLINCLIFIVLNVIQANPTALRPTESKLFKIVIIFCMHELKKKLNKIDLGSGYLQGDIRIDNSLVSLYIF